jgi:hypothetical protein
MRRPKRLPPRRFGALSNGRIGQSGTARDFANDFAHDPRKPSAPTIAPALVRTYGVGEASIAPSEDGISTSIPRGFGISFGLARPTTSRERNLTWRPDLILPVCDQSPFLLRRLRRSKRHRHWPRPAPYCPPWRRRRQTYYPAAWRQCRCAPFPIHHTDAALQSIHRSCLPRP